MSPFTCKREAELSGLLQRGQWPQASPADLRAHVASCRSCSDLIVVTETLQAARKQTTELPRLEAAGAIWWRSQLRRRNAAIEQVTRPIFGAQLFAFAMALVVLAAVAVWQAGTWSAWFAELPGTLHLDALIPSSMPESNVLWVLLPTLATIALLSGVVVYLTSEKR